MSTTPTITNEPISVASSEEPANSATSSGTTRGVNSRLIETYVSETEQVMSLALNDPEIRSTLEAYGMDEADRATATRLVAQLRDSLQARAESVGAKTEASGELRNALQARRVEFQNFRDIVRACFPERSDRQTLSVAGDLPEEPARLISVATSSYQTAKKDTFQAKLAKRRYTPERLEALLASLSELNTMAADRTDAHVTAQTQTATRDMAYKELKTFMLEWKGIARSGLRHNPAALRKLGI